MDQLDSIQSQTQTGKSADPFKIWAIVLGLLFLAAGGFAVWQTMQVSELGSKVASLESSAAQLQADKNSIQAELNTLKGIDSTDDSGTQKTPDSVKILAAVDAYVRAPVEAKGKAFEYNVLEVSDGFARVNVGPSEIAGYALWLKKVGENWTVLFGGQDMPGQDMIDKYGIPESILQ